MEAIQLVKASGLQRASSTTITKVSNGLICVLRQRFWLGRSNKIPHDETATMTKREPEKNHRFFVDNCSHRVDSIFRGSMRGSVFFSFALLLAFCGESIAQDVVSASSGVLQYFEGMVALDNKPIEHKAAVFPNLNNGSTICTKKGRAELLLTPGIYLRIDENSCLRMVSNSLTDTRLNMTEGSAIFDNLNASPNDAVLLIHEGSEVRFPRPGVYRIDSDVGELQVYSGEARVTHHRVSTTVDSSHLYYFALELTTNKLGDGAMDEFYDWAHNRSDVIANQNQLASAEQDDAQNADPGSTGTFAVPPLYSLPSYAAPSLGYSTYGSTINPFYPYAPTPYPGFVSFASVLVLSPLRHWPSGLQWHGGAGSVYRPAPVITRWPSPTQGVLSHWPATGVHYPIGTSIGRPTTVTAMPHPISPPVAPHLAAPRVGAVGHR
jgi:hypothetical protein